MSSNACPSLSRRFALLGALALTGCGFAPAFGPDGGAVALQGRIAFVTGEGRFGYRLTEHLERRLGQSSAPFYTLSIETTVTESPVAVASDNTATRINLPAVASYKFSDENDVVLTSGTVQTFTSYSATGSTVATRTARQAAEDRLARMLADLVVARILAEAQVLAG